MLMSGIILQGVDNMANVKKNVVIAARIDNKGRITLPRSMRQSLGVDIGDTVFLKHDPQNNQLRLAPVVNPFDILAEHAIREYRDDHTKTIEEYSQEQGIRLNE